MIEKLVRSKIRFSADAQLRDARPDEVRKLLARKMCEEADELSRVLYLHDDFLPPAERRKQVVDELADISEVHAVVARHLEIPITEIGLHQAGKRYRLGTFERKVLTNAVDERSETKLRLLVEDCIAALRSDVVIAQAVTPDKLAELEKRASNLGCLDDLA